MATTRRKVGFCTLFAFFVTLLLGTFLLQRTWTFHSVLRDAQSNAAHLEKLYEEALDEAADWRKKYDADVKQVKEELDEKLNTIAALQLRIDTFRKNKLEMDETVARLQQELIAEKQKCETLSANRMKTEAS